MRLLLVILVATGVALALVGCGEKAQQSTPIEVENPKIEGEAPEEPKEPAATLPTPQEPRTAAKGFTMTKSGLQYKDTKAGAGAVAKNGDTVIVNYKGWLDNGKVFDSSLRPGRDPFSFRLGAGEVIKGWDEGVQGMKVGGTRELIIPPQLGYGSEDQGIIPPNSTLHFRVDLLEIHS